MVQCWNTLFPILTICSLFGLNTYLYIRVMTVVELKVLFFWWNGSFISCLGFIIWVCFEKKSSIFLWLLLLLSHVFVQNFLGFVQNRIFFVQKTEETPACFFWISRIFYSDSGFFLGVPCLFEWKSPVFSFTYPFFKSVFYLVGYDSLVSFPSVCLFLRILLIKNLFFQNEPSFRKCIFSLFVWVFSYFFRCFGRFFCPASHPFLHFSFRLRKICCFFSSGSSVFWDFFASSG